MTLPRPLEQISRERLIEQVTKLAQGQSVDFDLLAYQVYQYQYKHCEVYRSWAQSFDKTVESVADIPKLHISAWKNHQVISGAYEWEQVYTSSGTTGSSVSKHHVRDVNYYLQNSKLGFEAAYGPISNYCVLGLLPSYLERQGSSLVAMVESFIKLSKYPNSGTYLYDHAELHKILTENSADSIPTLLIGVSFGLLDFVEQYQLTFPELIVMETGGMKGRRTEMSKVAMHTELQEGFGVPMIHSEYGMTELLSQAYSSGNGLFFPSATLKVLTTEINDPLALAPYGKSGIINIIDLANIDSCSFICTEDLGIRHEDGSFEIIGRLDNSELRGCSLMVSDL